MIEAINNHDDEEFSKELGDVFLHVIMHSVMAEERGAFNNIDVLKKIKEKLVYRQPHVFAAVHVNGEKDVMRNWENLKMKEVRTYILEGVPQHLPALIRAERMQFKASKVGFDWDNREGVWDKIREELEEFKQELDNNNKEKAAQELGDIIFAIVNAARFEGIEPEAALQLTNNKFKKRFMFIELQARKQNKMLSDMTLEEMDKYWDEAKELENK
jgi:MazG family protein